MILPLLSTVLVGFFVVCCVVSAALQILAWSRHSRTGVPVSVRALWHPEGFFDETGMHQIRVARVVLTMGIFGYLMYGMVIVLVTVFGRSG
jgi:hypothetical protein